MGVIIHIGPINLTDDVSPSPPSSLKPLHFPPIWTWSQISARSVGPVIAFFSFIHSLWLCFHPCHSWGCQINSQCQCCSLTCKSPSARCQPNLGFNGWDFGYKSSPLGSIIYRSTTSYLHNRTTQHHKKLKQQLLLAFWQSCWDTTKSFPRH